MDEKDFFVLLLRNLERNSDRLSEIEKTQAAHLEVLKDHTRRSMANEEAIIVQKTAAELANNAIIDAIKPLQKHVTQVETVLKIAGLVTGGVVALAGLILSVVEIIKHLG